MYDSTFTFKIRQKHHLLLLTCLVILINNVASMAMPVTCPEPCECYLNNNGLQSARCSEIYPNQTEFSNIHVLVLRKSETQKQCTIPKDIHLVFPQLNYFYAMNCSLVDIPVETFKDLQFLQEIDLSYNFMKNIEPSLFINNPKLIYANLQNNRFRIPDRPFLISKSLRELDLSSCGIKELPENMFNNLTNVKYLTLNNNKLSTIEKGTLPNGLKLLSLSKNNIKHVPMGEIKRLKKIREVDISENPVNCTCALMNFDSWMSDVPIMFINGVECRYPEEYRGRQLGKMPEYELCDAKVAAMSNAELDAALQLNQILPDEEPVPKKDSVKNDFEIDQVVPFDKKSNADYIDQMQSDSISDEGSGDGGDSTDTPEDVVIPKQVSNNNESNETKPNVDGEVPPTDPKPEQPAPSEETTTEKKKDVTYYEQELPAPNNTDENVKPTDTELTISPNPTDVSEKKPEEAEVKTEVSTSTSEQPPSPSPENPPSESAPEPKITTTPEPELKPTESEPTKIEVPETTKPNLETITQEQQTKSENDASSTSEPSTIQTSEKPVSEIENAQLRNTPETHGTPHPEPISASSFSVGYIIPCLAILIIIIICLGIYFGQRSSHKNWEPNNGTNANDGGAELQDVSLLPDKSKPPIVKNNKKYPSEENSEQTERLMSDGEASTPRSIWEHLEEPIENGNAKHSKDSDKLPNGQPIDKNEPIECAIAKVTTLPDSIPRTPLIRNT
ncbi:protein windpipe [Planococcus citri]|uniref:protein windpipe n=1 Tax=Planococcus citri TaxID=170843 RepID=UPI0031F95DED